jgi:glycogen(starch) synthase
MRILLATDAFPPVCGGSGWSTYELAKGLRARGHTITIVRPRVSGGHRDSRRASGSAGGPEAGEGWSSGLRDPGDVEARSIAPDAREQSGDAGVDTRSETHDGGLPGYDGFDPIEVPVWAPGVPFLRNYLKNERFYARLANVLATLIRTHAIDIVHGQHQLTGPPSVTAARRAGIPVVCTVRDYWPVCYWADLIDNPASGTLCPRCSAAMMTRCLRPRAGRLWPLAVPMIPYMRANLAWKQRSLSAADAIVAVSAAIATDLRERAAGLASARIEAIPNPVDTAAIRAAADRGGRPLASPYAVYAGKLAPNKGVQWLPAAIARAGLDWPIVLAGDGPARAAVEQAFRTAGSRAHVTGWLPREAALRWMRHAEMLIFPSYWREPLSRVLIEASALGVPIAAMDTGGTREIVADGETGLLSRTVEALGDSVARLRHDEPLRRRLGEAARLRMDRLFDTRAVVGRFEALYSDLVGRRQETHEDPRVHHRLGPDDHPTC